MSQPKPTYILAPGLRSPPDGPIRLGNIIASPSSPEEPLNTTPPPPIPQPLGPWTNTKKDLTISNSASYGRSGSLFAQFLAMAGIGADVGGSFEGNRAAEFKISAAEWEWFNPNKDYIESSLKDTDVWDYLKANRWRKAVYMVTGIVVARGAKVLLQELKKRGLHMSVGVSAAAAGVPINVGPKGKLDWEKSRDVSFDGGTDFVLAFRLTKIKLKKGVNVDSSQYVKGAWLSSRPRDEPEQTPDLELVMEDVEVGSLEAEDAAEEYDDDDNGCKVLVLSSE